VSDNKASIYTTWPLYLSVAVLILNDHYYKEAYPSWITGKLSDFAGIFLIVLLLRSIAPNHIHKITAGVIIIFAFWKSTYSQPLIDSINAYSSIKIGRVVDLTDLLAFSMIPVAHFVSTYGHKYKINLNLVELLKIPVIIATVLAITGTSVVIPHHNYTIRKESEEQKIERVKSISLISKVAEKHNLFCIKCEPSEINGEFKNKEITLRYTFLPNYRGIEFHIFGNNPPRLFFDGTWDELDDIKIRLQRSLSSEFKDMEFVIKLPKEMYFNGR